ncbi:hypothetical protein IC582_001761 [Cucumis melo]
MQDSFSFISSSNVASSSMVLALPHKNLPLHLVKRLFSTKDKLRTYDHSDCTKHSFQGSK